MKRISIGTWAYTIGPYADHPIDLDTVCTRLKELGFDGVELGGFPPHPNPDDLPEKSQRDELKAKMAEVGLAFSGLAANLWDQHLIDTDDTADYIAEFTKNADFCRDVGIAGIRVDTVQPPTVLEQVDPTRAMAQVAATWRVCCDAAADRGLYVTWEFEPGFAFNKPSEIVRLLDMVDKPNFGVLYDTCHGQMVAVNAARQPGQAETLDGGQVELLQMLHGRINHVHLIDSDNTCHKDEQGNDETSAHPPFGAGVLEFDKIMPVLAAEPVGHDWWTIDLCFHPDAWEATAACKKYADELNRKYG